MWALAWVLLSLVSFGIAYQDFKTRFISVWLILLFSIVVIFRYVLNNTISQLAENAIFCLCYFLFCFLILFIIYYLKTKKVEKLIDKKIGMADILLFIAIGITLSPINLIYFFTACFLLSAIIHLSFFKRSKHVPLAGFLVIFYLIYLIFEKIDF